MKKELTGIITCMFLFTGFSTASAAPADDRDCGNFASNQEIMQFWINNGYSASNDPHDLDRDSDGLPCEVPQSEYDSFVESQESSSTTETNSTITTSETNQNESSSATETSSTATTSETEQGDPMPDTASNGLLYTLMSAGLAGAGFFLLFRRKKPQA